MINESLNIEKPSSGTFMEFHTAQERLDLLKGERDVIDKKVESLIKTGANVIISTNAIDNISLYKFSRNGIIALRHVNKDLFEKVLKAVGGKAIYSINQIWKDYPNLDDLQKSILGFAEKVEIIENENNT